MVEFVERVIEMRAIDRNEIIDYFISINGKRINDGKIVGQGWEVDIAQEKQVALGSFSISAVIIVMRCKKELLDTMYTEFCHKFLRAGG